jgi:hypothetical protein
MPHLRDNPSIPTTHPAAPFPTNLQHQDSDACSNLGVAMQRSDSLHALNLSLTQGLDQSTTALARQGSSGSFPIQQHPLGLWGHSGVGMLPSLPGGSMGAAVGGSNSCSMMQHQHHQQQQSPTQTALSVIRGMVPNVRRPARELGAGGMRVGLGVRAGIDVQYC